jgi:DNA polymerase delta subunit 1
MMDEDVFLDEAILAEDEAALLMVHRDEAALLMVQRDEALASRLSRWKRPALPADLVAGCSRSIGTDHSPYQQYSLIHVWMTSGLWMV